MSDTNKVEKYLRNHLYLDSQFNDEMFIKSYKKVSEEVVMAEKKGGAKVVVWLLAFVVIVGLGWFGLTKLSLIKKQEQLTEGSAIVATLVVGEVDVLKSGAEDWRILRVNDMLEMGDEVRTGNDAYCELQMVGRGIFHVEAETELNLALLTADDEGNVNLRMGLSSGEIALKPQELGERETFEVETATAVAAVRGTKFSVRVNETGDTRIAVAEGKVAVVPNISAIDDAVEQGQVSAGAADYLESQVVEEVNIEVGEEISIDSGLVKTLDTAISVAVKDFTETSGPITEENVGMTETEDTESETDVVAVSIVDQVKNNVVAQVEETTGSTLESSESLMMAISVKQELSEDAKAVLDQVSEDRIIERVADLVTVNYTSTPSGADLYIDGKRIGVTPFTQVIEKGTELNVRMVYNGYEEYSDSLTAVASGMNNRMNVSGNLALIEVEVEEVAQADESAEDVIDVEVADADEVETEEVAETEEETVAVVEEIQEPVVPSIYPGDQLWSSAISFLGEADVNNPEYYAGKVFVTSGTTLYILDSANSSVKTVSVTSDGALTRPSKGNGYIYVGSESGGVWCYDTDGGLVWKSTEAGNEMFGNIYPSASDGMVAVASSDKGVIVFDGYSGSVLHRITESDQIFSSPVIVNDGAMLVYGTQLGDVVGYDLTTGAEAWRNQAVDKVLYPLVGSDDAVVVLERSSGVVYGLDPATGESVWDHTYSSLIKTGFQPVYSGNKVAFVAKDGSKVYELYVPSGDLLVLKSFAGITTTPFIDGRWLYVGNDSGEVFAFNYYNSETWTSSVGGVLSLVVSDDDGVYGVTDSKITLLYQE